ncbi:MAG: hypothetical protein MR589_07345 [Lachnobacterium sp.]|nr:hypothetical protein [Lachnobacterium sp.]MCI7532549.1 hypothetical protein [Lachnobacterium sp.]
MEKIKNRIISGMMALVLVVSLMAVAPVNTYAETKYVKSYTQTYTLKKSTKYKIPLKMKQDADLTVQITILDGTAGEQMYVVPWLWEDYEELLGVSCNGDEELGLGYYAKGKKRVDEVTFKGAAAKGNKSFITIGVGHTDNIKLRVKITSKNKTFCPQDIEVIKK